MAPVSYRVPSDVAESAKAALHARATGAGPRDVCPVALAVARRLASESYISEHDVRRIKGYFARRPRASDEDRFWGGEASARWADGTVRIADARLARELALASWRDRVAPVRLAFDARGRLALEQERCPAETVYGGQFTGPNHDCDGNPTEGAGERSGLSLRGADSSQRHALWMLRNRGDRIVTQVHHEGRSQYTLTNGWTITVERVEGTNHHSMVVTRAGEEPPVRLGEVRQRAREEEEQRRLDEDKEKDNKPERNPALPNLLEREGAVDGIRDFRVAGAQQVGWQPAVLVSRLRSDTPEAHRATMEHVGQGHTRWTLPSGARLDVLRTDRGLVLIGSRRDEPDVEVARHANPPLTEKEKLEAVAARGAIFEKAASDHVGIGFGSRTPGDGRETEALVRSTYEGTFGGLTARVTAFSQFADSLGEVYGKVYDPDGNQVGTFHRTFSADGKTVTHQLLTLNPDVQGNGFANEFNRQAEAYYASHGVEKIKVHADIDVGGYTWAAQGFNWENDRPPTRFVAALRELSEGRVPSIGRLHQGPYRAAVPEDLREAARALPRARFSAYELSQLGRDTHSYEREIRTFNRRENRYESKTIVSWPGKDLMLGTDWRGAKQVSPLPTIRAAAFPGEETGWASTWEDDVAVDRWVAEQLAAHGEKFAPGYVSRRPSDYNLHWLYVDLGSAPGLTGGRSPA